MESADRLGPADSRAVGVSGGNVLPPPGPTGQALRPAWRTKSDQLGRERGLRERSRGSK